MAGMSLSLLLAALLAFTTLLYTNDALHNRLVNIPSLLQFATTEPEGIETYTLSEDPLVVYIPNFISPSEAVQLVDLR